MNPSKKTIIVISLFLTIMLMFCCNKVKKSYAGISMVASVHDFTPTGPAGQNFAGGVCSACHIPHKSQDIRLWPYNPNIGPQNANEMRRLCLNCHGYNSIASPPLPALDGVNWNKLDHTPPRVTDTDGTRSGAPTDYDAQSHDITANCGDCHLHKNAFLATCDLCHGSCSIPEDLIGSALYGAPDYDNGGPGVGSDSTRWKLNKDCATINNANSHIAHLTRGGLGCGDCHFDTVSDKDPAGGWSLQNPSKHMISSLLNDVDMKDVDVISDVSEYGKFGPADLPAEKYEPLSNDPNIKKRCFKSCHGEYNKSAGAEAPQWGGTFTGTGGCFICHGGTETSPRPKEAANKMPNKVNKDQYEMLGHGLPTTSFYSSENPGAGFNDYTAEKLNPGCYSLSTTDNSPTGGCHWLLADHYTKDVNDPYRLGITFATNVDGLCNECHGVGGSATVKDVITHTKDLTGSELNWDADGKLFESRQPKCVDCHDPHGDQNASGFDNNYMIKYAISSKYGSTLYGSPALLDGSANAGTTPAEINLMVQTNFTLTLESRTSVVMINNPPGRGGDYYNLDADLINGVCQVCHTQNNVYNNIEKAGEVTTHHDLYLTPLQREKKFRCTECHKHSNSFKIP